MAKNKKKPKVLIIYTGGTIGMIKDKNDVLLPFTFNNLLNFIPLLENFSAEIDSISFDKPIDSSNFTPTHWTNLVNIISNNYEQYDGFVILHGSDTMAYTASALSFMLENLKKPVILTGSQLPIGLLRTDGRENIIASLELAALQKDNKPAIQEVCVYFENYLYRGNRTHKYNTENFDAFISPNYPPLAKVGTNIEIYENNLNCNKLDFLISHTSLNNEISTIKLFPGIQAKTIDAIFSTPDLRAVIIESYGSGNGPTDEAIINIIDKHINNGIIVLNVSQCQAGKVIQGKYATSLKLKEIGVISGKDMTTETAIVKTMYLLGQNLSKDKIEKLLQLSLRGELTEN
jgi:L-asparaginase